MSLQLKKILEQRKLSVLALSKMTGITQANLSNIVNGKASPNKEILERIANALEIETWQLLKDEEQNNSVFSFTCPKCHTVFELKPRER